MHGFEVGDARRQLDALQGHVSEAMSMALSQTPHLGPEQLDPRDVELAELRAEVKSLRTEVAHAKDVSDLSAELDAMRADYAHLTPRKFPPSQVPLPPSDGLLINNIQRPSFAPSSDMNCLHDRLLQLRAEVARAIQDPVVGDNALSPERDAGTLLRELQELRSGAAAAAAAAVSNAAESNPATARGLESRPLYPGLPFRRVNDRGYPGEAINDRTFSARRVDDRSPLVDTRYVPGNGWSVTPVAQPYTSNDWHSTRSERVMPPPTHGFSNLSVCACPRAEVSAMHEDRACGAEGKYEIVAPRVDSVIERSPAEPAMAPVDAYPASLSRMPQAPSCAPRANAISRSQISAPQMYSFGSPLFIGEDESPTQHPFHSASVGMASANDWPSDHAPQDHAPQDPVRRKPANIPMHGERL